ncbi:autotransporter assembly complex family protein [Pseudorhodobacter sp.]|uniref:autotransporter assembly complex protein TamA n=1 Tax=Pseudorhodobacter sp. TaxID=1934400 RepID=UPI002648DB3C|nr:autotransporter assembly complex family protein [Pseudorhodobacter sp.]MDN5787945.1 autotransporter assembly complex protein TamA [Pseudorhodobacter sp.]
MSRILGVCVLFSGAQLVVDAPARALDQLDFNVKGDDDKVADTLRDASLLLAAQAEGNTNPQDLFATARAEYGRLLGSLYAMGRYSGVIQIKIDGREAASIAPLDAPKQIGKITLSVDPGPEFRFSKAAIGPLAADTALPKGFAVGKVAKSDLVSAAASAAVDGWRNVGHAKADVTEQDLTADHRANTLAASLRITAGPRLRFGALAVVGNERMRLNRIIKIAGLPTGEQFSPEELEDAAERLRRTGVFSSVTLIEDDRITAPDTLGITAKLAEEKLRRYSFGVEVASSEGAKISGYWLHRNLFGGGERFKVEGEVAQIGAQGSGKDYSLGFSLDRPATLTPDATGTLYFKIAHQDEADYVQDSAQLGLNFTYYFSRDLTARAGIEYNMHRVKYPTRTDEFRTLGLPFGVNWDKRNVKADATHGYYIDAGARPFYGFGGTDSGFTAALDARAYYGFGDTDRVTIAGRLQAKAVLGASIGKVPPDYLFYSGGGGTVRGQAYQALGFVNPITRERTGGTGFIGASIEVRTRVTESIGIVGFYDYGQIASDGLFGGTTKSHAGAGLGIRYATGFGPIRLDIAAPVSGGGKKPQIYIGIGQAF